AARWIEATASRSAICRPPPVTMVRGSKPVVSGGTARRLNSSTQPLGTPWWRAVSTLLTRARTSPTPGEDRKPNIFAAYRSAAVGWAREVLHRHPPIRLQRLRRGRAALLSRACRETRLRGRLGTRTDHWQGTAADAAGAARVLRIMHAATAPRGGRAGVVV